MNIQLARLPALEPITPAYGKAVAQDPAAGSLIRNYIRIAQRWRWVILGLTVLALFLGLVITLLMTPRYTSTSTIEIAREAAKVTDIQGVEREASIADQEFYQTQYGLLRSRSLSERIATRLRLVDDPAFFDMFDFDPGDDPAFALTNGRYPSAGRDARRRQASEILLDNLSIEPTRMSRLVAIAFTSPDPSFSAKVANSWAENFIETNLERKVQATSYGREQLQRQLADYKARLDESQSQLVAYATNQQIINLPAQSDGAGNRTQERPLVADQLAALSTALTEAVAERIRIEARARQRGVSEEALENQAINNLRQRRAELSAEYNQLLVRFEPGYPAAAAIRSNIERLDEAIQREEGRVTSSMQGAYRAAVQREQVLAQRVEQLKGDFLDQRRRSIQYNIYQQEVDTNRALYDGLLQRFKEIGVAGGVGVNNVAIVDRGEPAVKPSSPKLLLNLFVALAAGLLLGAGAALALEQLDEAIADPAEVERRLGLPLLGSVPRSTDLSPQEALQDRKSDLVDAYMAVQTNLGFTTEHGIPRSFAVTSTRPAEGKSTTALALATTLSRGGRKVILVDADMRSPSIHQFGGVDHDRGLSNFLSGDDDIASMTFAMQDLGFTAMSAGPLPPNAAELLTGNRFELLLQRLLDSYDHVIIDSPPVMGLADAPLISSHVEGVIYVVESHGIRSTMVKTALARLASANVRLFGGVLTKFDVKRSQGGYGYEYGYEYGRSEGRTA